ncbi:hypothetical protein KM92DES2_11255 [uncultured Desulfovibrio sp.]|uniref:Uncharacterized protein n=1 Tax=uncultured Desulfovibrio sp. TaxID=167968 RepID=A0A212JJQ3_9BACT|nr:hypothetical protein KM92DES2_11255 [uncultured Desulfovibrio sp.]
MRRVTHSWVLSVDMLEFFGFLSISSSKYPVPSHSDILAGICKRNLSRARLLGLQTFQK